MFRAIGVYENLNNLTVNYAFKVYKKSRLQRSVPSPDPSTIGLVLQEKLVRRELAMWGRVNHKNVVKIFRLYESDDEDKMYVWMQYADMG